MIPRPIPRGFGNFSFGYFYTFLYNMVMMYILFVFFVISGKVEIAVTCKRIQDTKMEDKREPAFCDTFSGKKGKKCLKKNTIFGKKPEVRPNASGFLTTPDGRLGSIGCPKTPCFSAPGPLPGSLVLTIISQISSCI